MNSLKLSAALTIFGLLVAAPTFAQTPAAKQPTQEGGPSMQGPTGGNFNANPNYKQPTQEGGPSAVGSCGSPFNANPGANPDCKQRTQNLVPSSVTKP